MKSSKALAFSQMASLNKTKTTVFTINSFKIVFFIFIMRESLPDVCMTIIDHSLL